MKNFYTLNLRSFSAEGSTNNLSSTHVFTHEQKLGNCCSYGERNTVAQQAARQIDELHPTKLSFLNFKLLTLVFILIFGMKSTGWGQSAAGYSFATATGATLDAMSSSTNLVAAGSDEGVSSLTNIGFTFNYEGRDYTQFSVSANGFLKLGSPVTTAEVTNSVSSSSNLPKLAICWDDLSTAVDGKIHYVLTGSSPNRILKVEFRQYYSYGVSSAYNITSQIWLYETTNVIEFRYGTGTLSANSATIGVFGATSGVYMARNHLTNNTCASTGGLTTITTWPTSGTKYTFTPPTPLSGSINVGTSQTYTNLTGASGLFNAINNSGLSGNVTVNIVSDLTETGTVALNEWTQTGVGGYTLTIQSSAAVLRTISGTAVANATPMININGADRVTINGNFSGSGKYLLFRNTKTPASTGPTIQFTNGSTSCSLSNCDIENNQTTSTSGAVVIGNTGTNNITISGNNIHNATAGTTGKPYAGIYSNSSTNTLSISSNNIYNFTNFGINAAAVASGASITGNSFYQTASYTGAALTIYCINVAGTGSHIISDNYIGGSDASCGSTAWTVNGTAASYRFVGINLNLSTSSASSIQNNTISNIVWISTSGATTLPGVFCGIYATGAGTLANIGTSTGNTLSTLSVQSSSSGAISVGIAADPTGTSTISINNNNLNGITITGSTTSVSHSFIGIITTNASGTMTATINSNTVGHTSNSNSINCSTATTNAIGQKLSGIENSAAGTVTITNNLVANLNNANNGTGSTNNAPITRGIVSGTATATITGNTIRNLSTATPYTAAAGFSVIGIALNSSGAGATVSQNTIYALSNTNSTAVSTVIYLAGITYAGPGTGTNVVSRNNIYGLSVASTSAIANQLCGIYVSSGKTNFQNNMISLGNSISGGYGITGIYEASGCTNNHYHNSVYIGGSSVTGSTASYAFNSAVTTNTRAFQNNIFFNGRSNGVGTGKHYAITVAGTAANPAGLTSNHNIFFSNGTGGFLGLFNGVDQSTIAAWRTATGQDANSFNSNPQFIAPTGSTPDLHISTSVASDADANGTSIASVTDDFDGQTRSSLSAVDIGANAYIAVAQCATYSSPADAATDQLQTGVTLSWNAAVNASSYDVYFGTNNPPTNILNGTNQAGITYATGALSSSTTYYWNVIPKSSQNTQATGCNTVWSFTTQAATPTLSTSPTSIAFGNQCQSTTSSAQTFAITALNLTGTYVTVAAPTGFTVSEDGTNYYSSINVNHSSGSLSSKTIYVKFTPTTTTSYSANIEITGGGLGSTVNVALTGSGVNNLAGLSYSSATVTYCTATAITANSATLATSGGSVTYSGTLPGGLSLNASTGEITGTPSTASAAANYTITASNTCSNTTANVNITVLTKMASLSYTSATISACQNSAITSNTVASVTGSGTITYSISPSLPLGLSIDPNSGTISGTPSASSASASYTVTASNSCSSTTASVTIVVNATMSGTYTVGSGGNYATLTAAVAAYNSACLTGAVVFSLTDASYSGSETFPITINANTTASSSNTLTIKPATGITSTITGSNSSAIIKLNGADYVIIDGSNSGSNSRNLTISNSNTGVSSAVVWLASVASPADGATNNIVKNIITTGNATTTTMAGIISSGVTIGAVADSPNNGNTYQNNLISTSYYGIVITGASATESSNSVLSNSISSIGLQGIFASNQSGISISSNTISGVNSSTNINTAGIYISGSYSGGSISENKISDIKNTTAAGRQAMGIWLVSSSSSIGLSVSNNIIFDVANSGNSAVLSRCSHGIYIATGSGYNIFNNTVNINTNPTAANTVGKNAALYVASGVSSLDVRNNILMNSQSTSVLRYAIYSDAANSAFSTINYNNYYSTGTDLGFIGSTRASLSDIVTGFGQNANSTAILPTFVSSSDMHMDPSSSGNSSLDNTGTAIGTVTQDIDGASRSGSTPDMGADEFAISTCTSSTGGTASSATSSYCTSGTTTLSATGYSSGVGTTYQWESSSALAFTSPSNLGSSSSSYASISTGSISSTTYYRLKVTCSADPSNPSYSNVVTITINTPETISVTASSTLCSGQSTTLSVSGASTYTWSPSTGLSATTGSSVTANPTSTTTYTITGVDANGCTTASAATTLTIDQTPSAITASQSSTVCAGSVATLTTSGGSLSGSGFIGTGTVNPGATSYPNPLSSYYGGARHQMLFTVSELNTLGLSANSVITSLGLNLSAFVAGSCNDFTIRIIPTALTSLTTFVTGGTTVYNNSYTPSATGQISFTLSTSYTWNGTSNLIIEMVHNAGNSGSGSGTRAYCTTTSTNMCYYGYNDGITPATSAAFMAIAPTYVGATTSRPNVLFAYATPTTISWSPTTDLYSDLAATTAYTGGNATTVYAQNTTSTSYTVTATNGSCTSTNSISTSINTLPTITLGSTTPVCNGGTSSSLSYTATTGSPNQYTIDYDATANGQGFIDVTTFTSLPSSPISLVVPTGATPGTYNGTIIVKNSTTGCQSTAYAFTVTINSPVLIGTQPSSSVVLENANASFTVSATGSSLTYQWEESTNGGSSWSSVSNTGIYSGATTATLSLTGVTSSQNSYKYRVVVGGASPCTSVTSSEATLTVSTTAITAHPQDQTICTSAGTAGFSITTSGTTPTYQWQVSTDGGSTFSDISSANSSSLSLSGLTISDNAKKYRCALSSGSIYSNAALLTVYSPPSISSQPSDLIACSNATSGGFSVTASGSNLTYQWQVSTDGGSSWSNASGANVSGATSASLSFTSFSNSMDGYKYKVTISGSAPCSSVTSSEVTLSITGIIALSASSSTICLGSAVTLTATPTSSSTGLSYSTACATAGSGAVTPVAGNAASITPTAAGSYTYTLTTTGGSCTLTNTVGVT